MLVEPANWTLNHVLRTYGSSIQTEDCAVKHDTASSSEFSTSGTDTSPIAKAGESRTTAFTFTPAGSDEDGAMVRDDELLTDDRCVAASEPTFELNVTEPFRELPRLRVGSAIDELQLPRRYSGPPPIPPPLRAGGLSAHPSPPKASQANSIRSAAQGSWREEYPTERPPASSLTAPPTLAHHDSSGSRDPMTAASPAAARASELRPNQRDENDMMRHYDVAQQMRPTGPLSHVANNGRESSRLDVRSSTQSARQVLRRPGTEHAGSLHDARAG